MDRNTIDKILYQDENLDEVSSRKHLIKVIGIFRSGTNLLKHVLMENYECDITFSKWGWKHALAPSFYQDRYPLTWPVPTILVYKDPVSSIWSLHKFWLKRRPKLNPHKKFSDFLRDRLIVYDNTFDITPRYSFCNPVEYWNQYHYSYLNWKGIKDKLYIIDINEMTKSPAKKIEELTEKLGLNKLSLDKNIILPDREIMPSHDGASSQLGDKYNSSVMMEYEDLKYIMDKVDWEIAGLLSYERHSLIEKYTNKES